MKLTNSQRKALNMLSEGPCRPGQWAKGKINAKTAFSLKEKGLVNVGKDESGDVFMLSKEGSKVIKELK